MSRRRTNVYADAEDLDLIKAIANRRGVSEAEVIREGIHLAAIGGRVWDDEFDWPAFREHGTVVISPAAHAAPVVPAAAGRSLTGGCGSATWSRAAGQTPRLAGSSRATAAG